jgi:hypothetical protein
MGNIIVQMKRFHHNSKNYITKLNEGRGATQKEKKRTNNRIKRETPLTNHTQLGISMAID